MTDGQSDRVVDLDGRSTEPPKRSSCEMEPSSVPTAQDLSGLDVPDSVSFDVSRDSLCSLRSTEGNMTATSIENYDASSVKKLSYSVYLATVLFALFLIFSASIDDESFREVRSHCHLNCEMNSQISERRRCS